MKTRHDEAIGNLSDALSRLPGETPSILDARRNLREYIGAAFDGLDFDELSNIAESVEELVLAFIDAKLSPPANPRTEAQPADGEVPEKLQTNALPDERVVARMIRSGIDGWARDHHDTYAVNEDQIRAGARRVIKLFEEYIECFATETKPSPPESGELAEDARERAAGNMPTVEEWEALNHAAHFNLLAREAFRKLKALLLNQLPPEHRP